MKKHFVISQSLTDNLPPRTTENTASLMSEGEAKSNKKRVSFVTLSFCAFNNFR